MQRKQQVDGFGAVSLVGFSALLGFNQVVIKVVNDGLSPVFSAGLRSLGALILLALWMRYRGGWQGLSHGTRRTGLLMGSLFALEFLLLFQALDLTSVARTSVIFYSMPVWLALGAHMLVPGERISVRKGLGLAVAFVGVGWALWDRGSGGPVSLTGDLMALAAAFCWAGIALLARVGALSGLRPVMQLFWQVSVSTVILLALAPFFGALVRDFAPVHALGLGFQILGVATGGYLFWFWLLKIYPASSVASFGFLSPVFGVLFGWLILGEEIGVAIMGALVLVAGGIYLINTQGQRR
jgi:drug/metabolite transporter (DMT)-like permease